MERTLEIFSRSDQGDEDEQGGDLIPYLMTKTDLTEQEVITIISEFFFAGVDTVSLLHHTHFWLLRSPCIGRPEMTLCC